MNEVSHAVHHVIGQVGRQVRRHVTCHVMQGTMGATMVLAATCASAQAKEHIYIDAGSTTRTVCKLRFEKIPGLVIDARKLPQSFLYSRVNYDRFHACPYQVELRYQGRRMKLDFGNAVTLAQLDPAARNRSASVGYFMLTQEGWQVQRHLHAPADERVGVIESAHGYTVYGLVDVRDDASKQPSYCAALSVIGHQGFAAGGDCDGDRSKLAPWLALLRSRPVLQMRK